MNVVERIVKWLDTKDGHTIYDENKLEASFYLDTGEDPCWRTHTIERTRQMIASDPRGGDVSGSGDELCSYGYEIAYDLAEKYANFRSQKMGRGFMFRDCLEALRKASKGEDTATTN